MPYIFFFFFFVSVLKRIPITIQFPQEILAIIELLLFFFPFPVGYSQNHHRIIISFINQITFLNWIDLHWETKYIDYFASCFALFLFFLFIKTSFKQIDSSSYKVKNYLKNIWERNSTSGSLPKHTHTHTHTHKIINKTNTKGLYGQQH